MLKRLCAAAALITLLAGPSRAETGNAANAGLTAAVTVPAVEVVDGTMDGDAIRRVLSGDFAGHADELARLKAKSITIPEITVTLALAGPEPVTSAVVYRDISLLDVTDGVAQSVTIGGIETTSADGTRFNFGKMSTGLFDIPALLRFYGMLPGEAGSEPKTVYENLTFEGGTLTAKDATCTLGPISIAGVKARPLKVSLDDLMKAAAGLAESSDKPSPADISTYIGFMTDLPYAVEISPMTFGGFNCTGTDKGKPVTVGLGAINVGAYAKGILPRVSADNLNILVDDGYLSFGNLVVKSIDLTKTIAAFSAADPAAIDEHWFIAHRSELVPELEGWSVADFKMDLPANDDPGTRFRVSVATADVTAKNYVDGIPAETSLNVSHVVFPLPADAADNPVKTLRELGFDDVDLSFELAAAWDKASQTIRIGRLAFDGVDIGSVDADAVLGNVTKALFSDDRVEQMAAMLVSTLDQINIDVEDRGIGQHFDQMAVKQGKEPAAMRRTFSQVAEAGIVAALGGTPDAAELGAAVAAFLGGAKSLSVSIRARDGNSLSMAEWSRLAQDPQSVGDRLSIDATAK